VSQVKPEAGSATESRRLAVARKPALVFILLFLAAWCVAQTSSGVPDAPRGVLHLRVKIKTDEAPKGFGLSRKRFFLIKGSLEQNKALIEAIDRQPLTTRDCYYARVGASKELIDWLKINDCESVYCRELNVDDVEGPHAPREFTAALTAGEKTLGSRELARKWLTVSLPEKLRDGFYRERQNEIATIIKQAETSSGAKVFSVMTDRNGSAYFTDLEPGSYTLSNIVGTEIGSGVSLWNCDVQIRAEDLAAEKLYTISNRKDKLVKCVAVEKPLPACTP
jgi:hypothetical protein